MMTIIYLTDNTLDDTLMELCQRILLREAGDLPIVSVSQKPIDFGLNLCVGDIGRNWLSLYKQILMGCRAVKAGWVAIAEHDCLYNHEHFAYRPDDPGVFWYNDHMWLVQWGGNHPELNGMYSWWPKRLALSQLICDRDLLIESVSERVHILEAGDSFDKSFLGCGEPGVVSERALDKARRYAKSGKPWQLQPYLMRYLTKYDHKTFTTEIPNLDIRHSTNFSGPKRGKRRRYELPYWGRFEELLREG
jgi:hypothetical protein